MTMMTTDADAVNKLNQQKAPAGKLMSLDVGQARIGVAVCDPLHLAARPLTVIRRRSREEDFAALARLVQQEEAQAIICGLPLHMDGSEGAQAKSVRRWAQRLAQALRQILGAAPLILFWDERLSSYEAQSILAAHSPTAKNEATIALPARFKGGRDKGRRRKGRSSQSADDAVAAAVILQSYLDAHKAAQAGVENRIDYGRIEI
ncbi:MAG: Holliday junction resolvase RuvX [Caldilinea sp.]|jgi:putative Holliday junction resolvase|uniref:Holliday junction resolvase RuvX n=1 Tax=Caldilinea sp. TaxID=2293560 RepID=UPI003098A699